MAEKQLQKKSEEFHQSFVPMGSTASIWLSAAMVKQFIAVPTRSGALPSEKDCIKFVMLCAARQLNPFEGDAFLIGYDLKDGGAQFSLITAHQAFLKRAELSNSYNGMESGVCVLNENNEFVEREGDFTFSGEKLVGAWARVHFKDRATPMFKRIKREVYDTGRSRWEKDPAGMLVKCAEADALRSSFPTMLGGLYGEGEILKVIADGKAEEREPVMMPREIVEATPEPTPETKAETAKPKESKAEAQPSPERLAKDIEKLANDIGLLLEKNPADVIKVASLFVDGKKEEHWMKTPTEYAQRNGERGRKWLLSTRTKLEKTLKELEELVAPMNVPAREAANE